MDQVLSLGIPSMTATHCTDGSDEFDESNPTTFTCDNGDMISFESVNDGMY